VGEERSGKRKKDRQKIGVLFKNPLGQALSIHRLFIAECERKTKLCMGKHLVNFKNRLKREGTEKECDAQDWVNRGRAQKKLNRRKETQKKALLENKQNGAQQDKKARSLITEGWREGRINYKQYKLEEGAGGGKILGSVAGARKKSEHAREDNQGKKGIYIQPD